MFSLSSAVGMLDSLRRRSHSREGNRRQSSTPRSTSSARDQNDYPQSSYLQERQTHGDRPDGPPRRPSKVKQFIQLFRFRNCITRLRKALRIRGSLTGGNSRIADSCRSVEEVTKALAHAGLVSSSLVFGIDFTESNERTGTRSYNGKSLHDIGWSLNPYEQAISIIGRALALFNEDNLIPCYGFGDASTNDQEVFSFYPDQRVCNGFEKVLNRYREIVPHLHLAGPTSFAPVIEMAMNIVEQSSSQYHVLVIIADGQVTRRVETERGQLSPQEKRTVEAIVQASKFPLSIILVGVGDGPWDMIEEFYDNIPARPFNNFHFVNFTEIMSKNVPHSRKEIEFALSALKGIPSQYKEMKQLNIFGGQNGNVPERVPLPPPVSPSFPPSSPSSYVHSSPVGPDPPVSNSTSDDQVCTICVSNPKDTAFGCGHQTCCMCASRVLLCPFCRSPIQTTISTQQLVASANSVSAQEL